MVVWAVKSLVAYHGWTLEDIMADFEGSPMPMNEAGLLYWKNNIFVPYMGEKRGRIQFHTIFTTLMAIGLSVQFTKAIRRNAMVVHVWGGRATVAFALLGLPALFKLLHGFGMPTAQYVEMPVLYMIPYYGIQGWRQARAKQIQAHRSSMIMFSACFYYFGVQRLVMMALGPLHSGPWAKYMPLGPYVDWDDDDHSHAFSSAIALAFPLTFGLAASQAYGGVTSPLTKTKQG